MESSTATKKRALTNQELPSSASEESMNMALGQIQPKLITSSNAKQARNIHNAHERKYREDINSQIKKLKLLIEPLTPINPLSARKGPSKGEILSSAATHISELIKKEAILTQVLEKTDGIVTIGLQHGDWFSKRVEEMDSELDDRLERQEIILDELKKILSKRIRPADVIYSMMQYSVIAPKQ